jgi:ankyrin repeat protein
MAADTIDGDSLLLLLRDAIVQHSPLKDIKLILSCKEININRGVRRGLRPLHYAVFENDLECVRLLIEDYNADVNVLDEAGYSPLHLASKYGFIDIMHILIDHGSLINFHNAVNNSQTRSLITPYYDVMTEPLSLCLENNHIECARLLVFSGANVNQQYFLGYEINLLPYENLHALELILKHGANSNALSRSGITPLIKACREGNIGAVILLCRYGANVNYVTRKFRQRNAIITAIESKKCDIVEQLLAYGGFVNKHPDLCNSPLELAIRKDHIDTVRLLIGRLNRFLIVKYLFYQIAFSFSFWCRYK